MLSKDQILGHAARLTRIESSAVFGGDLCLLELSRGTFRAVQRNATIPGDEEMIDVERWNGGIFAAIVVDADTKQPLFTLDELLNMPHREELWIEIRRIAAIGLNFSEVGQAPLAPPSSD